MYVKGEIRHMTVPGSTDPLSRETGENYKKYNLLAFFFFFFGNRFAAKAQVFENHR